MVGRLHENVYFDENDFEDDDNIDLTDTDSHPTSTIQYPTLPQPSKNTYTTPKAASSQPLPWSSSPLKHFKTPSQRAVPLETKPKMELKNELKGEASTQTVNYPSLPSELNPPEPKKSKRRTIPWLAEDEGSNKGATHGVGNTKSQRLAPQSSRIKREEPESYTPLPNSNSDSPYPWNKTQSAIKEEQKRLRQGHRKLVKNVKDKTEDSEDKPQPTTGEPAIPVVYLSDEQRKVLNMVVEARKSVFFTGAAGTGKSVLLREIIRALKARHHKEADRVAVTASTGLAACNVGGVTLHSFAGIGLGKEAVPELVRKIKRNPKARNRWMRTKVLIVDEISMVDGDLFDKLEGIARTIRNNGRPFGGIQLVITGDFFQLPPVPDHGKVARFCFDAGTWTTSIEHTIGLTQVFRQRDPGMLILPYAVSMIDGVHADRNCLVFANMLNEMRLGRLTPKSIDSFRSLNRPLGFQDSFHATELSVPCFVMRNADSIC